MVGSLGVPALNGSATNQSVMNLPINGQAAVTAPVLPVAATIPVGSPTECLLLNNMFDPATEVRGFLVNFGLSLFRGLKSRKEKGKETDHILFFSRLIQSLMWILKRM